MEHSSQARCESARQWYEESSNAIQYTPTRSPEIEVSTSLTMLSLVKSSTTFEYISQPVSLPAWEEYGCVDSQRVVLGRQAN